MLCRKHSNTLIMSDSSLTGTYLEKSETVRWWGCCLGGLSQEIKCRSWLTVVFLNSLELQITVWKYPSGEERKLA